MSSRADHRKLAARSGLHMVRSIADMLRVCAFLYVGEPVFSNAVFVWARKSSTTLPRGSGVSGPCLSQRAVTVEIAHNDERFGKLISKII